MIKRFCKCGRMTLHHSCEKCRPKPAPPNRTTGERGYDYQWQRLSFKYRCDHPLCEDCETEGRVVPATSVHHKEPIREAPHLRLEWSNLMALCERCHRQRDAELRKGNGPTSPTYGAPRG